MSAVDPLSSSPALSGTGSNGYSALSSSEFMKIMFTELTNQDPMSPNDSQALLQQISTIRSIQSSVDLSDKLNALVGQSEWTSAAGLIGKRISGLTDTLQRIEGTVKSVSRTDMGAVLNLETGERVPVSFVDEVLGSGTAQAMKS